MLKSLRCTAGWVAQWYNGLRCTVENMCYWYNGVLKFKASRKEYRKRFRYGYNGRCAYMVLTTQERSEMYNRRFMRRRFNIPRTDEVTQRWYEAQVNPSQSLRLLVELFVEAYGETADVEYEAKMDDGFARLARMINDRSGHTSSPATPIPTETKTPQPQKTPTKKETSVSTEKPELQEMSQKELDALSGSSQSESEPESKDTDEGDVNLNLYDL